MGCSGNQKVLNKEIPHYQKNYINPKDIKSENDIKITSKNLIHENKDPVNKHYKLVKKLGRGSFGSVYKCIHISTGRPRALKVIKASNINYQDNVKNNTFLNEIEILSELDHPCILKIYEYFSDYKNYYVIMELVEGGELYDEINKVKHFTETDAAYIMSQLLSAVHYMHNKGIVHRDLKPENIMVEERTEEGIIKVKIIDFGTSKYYTKNETLSLKVGTPYYIAPEVLKKEYNNKCDIWSLGIILYILLSGRAPFEGKSNMEIIEKVKKGKVTFDRKEWTNVSQGAKNLISKMLTYKFKERPSAMECLNDSWIKDTIENSSFDKRLYTKKNSQIEIAENPLQNLKRFSAQHKFQQATIAFLVRHVANDDMFRELKNIFNEFDTNKDGILSYEEVKAGFQKYYSNEKLAEHELQEILKKLDQDQNDEIELEEFIRNTVNLETLLTSENLRLAFDAFDKDSNGTLSPDEIKLALGVLNCDSNNKILNDIINNIDLNGDGEISFDEFKSLMLKVFESQ